MKKCLEYIDIFLFDIKHLDPSLHKKYTSVSNELIKANLYKLSNNGQNIIIRVSYIPGVNNSKQNIEALGEFLKDINVDSVDILPYHKLGLSKYKFLGRSYLASYVINPNDDEINEMKDTLFNILGVKIEKR